MKKNHKFFGFGTMPLRLMLAALSWLAMNVAFAQSAPPSTVQYLAATGPDDASVKVFKHLVGDFFTSPLSFMGGAETLMGTLFLIFNGFIFVVAMLWMSYGIIFKVVSTASSGEVMGGKLSAAWLPVRYLTGIAGIMPIFGGFSLSQVLLVTTALLGIGVTNFATNKALEATAQFQGLVSPALAGVKPGGAMSELTRSLFIGYVCLFETTRQENKVRYAGVTITTTEAIAERPIPAEFGVAGVALGTTRFPSLCGIGKVQILDADEGREASTWTGSFRVASVNYEAIARNAQQVFGQAHARAFPSYAADVKAEAQRWHQAWVSSRATDGVKPNVDLKRLEAIGQSYLEAVQAAARAVEAETSSSVSAITDQALAEMKRYGWFGLGAWYSTFAEVNAAIADASNVVKISGDGPGIVQLSNSEVYMALYDAGTGLAKADEERDGGRDSDSGVWRKICEAIGLQTPTGNCSLGQGFVELAISGTAANSGGEGLVNPIIMFKNMGDWAMTIGQAMIIFSHVPEDEKEEAKDEGIIEGAVDSVGSAVGGKLYKLYKTASNMWDAFVAMLPTIGAVLFLVGALMALYIPFIPFITWMGAIIQYVVVVVEGLVGMPIAALSHMDSDGEGMGQRTERGYIFLLNVAFRPFLMVIGFFAASALIIIIGTFQAELFVPAMANVQGNSVTGVASIVGLLIIFFVMNVTLIQGLFNMIFLLPDQVLGLIGAGTTDPIGKETEDKVHNMFMATARFGQGAAAEAMAGKISKTGEAMSEKAGQGAAGHVGLPGDAPRGPRKR